MKVTIAYTDYCLPDYFRGDHRPWVAIHPIEGGYTSRELRNAILSEFAQGVVGGNDPITQDFIPEEKDQLRAAKFYEKALPACLNRDIKFRGKKLKYAEEEEGCVMYFVFDIEE